MKKIVLFISFTIFLFANDMKWFKFDKALNIAKNSNKIVMIKAMSQDCHYCIEMERDVLNDKEVMKEINRYFIPVKIDIYKDNLPVDINVYLTPTFIFIDKNKKVIKKIPGAWHKEDFLNILDEVRKIK
ncbi:thioredoxin family protein [Nitrosophilus kaiyonis]|uniref:thioredoxin family protein n=1 Tax=Nitrosophilus kaiyonis TaxID=2930200 RepID=UPI002491B726|nr:thioredoxin fold domain-containing protein [Nitrosophilus kaiyonis]